MNDVPSTTGPAAGGRPSRVPWRISSRSQTSNCVEVAPLDDARACVALRDSKDPGGPILLFDRRQWLDFIAGAKDGEFDVN